MIAFRVVVAAGIISAALGASGCGGTAKSASSSTTPVTIDAGDVNIQLPPGWKVTKHGVVRPTGAAAADGSVVPGAGGATGDTIPLAKADPTTTFFKAVSVFSACLKESGVKFIGAPDPKNPSSPANDPNYLKSLSTCAAKSNILKALKDQQAAQDNLTPAQIEQQNKGYLKWRDCMIGHGVGIPEPKPDAKGRLFSFGGAGGGAPQFNPPPGQDITSSPDVSQCASQSQKEVGSGNSGG